MISLEGHVVGNVFVDGRCNSPWLQYLLSAYHFCTNIDGRELANLMMTGITCVRQITGVEHVRSHSAVLPTTVTGLCDRHARRCPKLMSQPARRNAVASSPQQPPRLDGSQQQWRVAIAVFGSFTAMLRVATFR